jgi:hypothetical protein
MASKDPAESVGEAIYELLKIIFSLTFPVMLITLCGVSFVLTAALHAPEFALWAGLAMSAVQYAKANGGWAAIALVVFVLAALPLAWIGFREREIRASKAILEWVITAIIFLFIFWLRTVWVDDTTGWRIILFGFLLFTAWNGVIESAMSTLAIVAHVRRNRPRPVAPPQQQPHGAPQAERRGRDEPETI